MKVAVEDEYGLSDGTMRNVDVLNQDLVSLVEKIDDMQYISYDGTFTWKITKRSPSTTSFPQSFIIAYKTNILRFLICRALFE